MNHMLSRSLQTLILFALFSGCAPVHQELILDGAFCSVEVVLPETGESYPREANSAHREWLIMWRDADGDLRYVNTDKSRVLISVERGITVPIRAWYAEKDGQRKTAEFSARRVLPDAGSIFPHYARWENGCGTVELSFLDGIAAETADSAIRNAAGGVGSGQAITVRFNWNRFRDELTKKTYPHLADIEAAASSILSGSFTLRNLREQNHIIASVKLPGPECGSPVRMGSPFGRELVATDPPENTALLPLAEGVNFFYSPKGAFAVLRAQDGDIVCIYEPYHLPDSPSSDTVDSI
ncbi:MAG: hypothetical protein JXP39_02505 [Spirochaetales bacterium]|nr:hypothetical protein [Spirochaetales bacterium]